MKNLMGTFAALVAFAAMAGCTKNDDSQTPSTTEGAKVKEYRTITMDIVDPQATHAQKRRNDRLCRSLRRWDGAVSPIS